MALSVDCESVVLVKTKRTDKAKPHSVLALLETCQQIHKEAEGLFYNIHKFRMETSLRRYHSRVFPSLNSIRRNAVVSIAIYGEYGEDIVQALRQLQWFPRLEFLEIRIRAVNRTHLNMLPWLSGEKYREEPMMIDYTQRLPRIQQLRCLLVEPDEDLEEREGWYELVGGLEVSLRKAINVERSSKASRMGRF